MPVTDHILNNIQHYGFLNKSSFPSHVYFLSPTGVVLGPHGVHN